VTNTLLAGRKSARRWATAICDGEAMTQELDLTQHPCFHQAARRTAARTIFRVAAGGGNVQCNFCDRRSIASTKAVRGNQRRS